MSPFMIFFIVVTIGYILYYAAIITMDMNAKPKDDASETETIDVADAARDAEDNTEESDEDLSPTSEDVVSEEPGDDLPFDNPSDESETYDPFEAENTEESPSESESQETDVLSDQQQEEKPESEAPLEELQDEKETPNEETFPPVNEESESLADSNDNGDENTVEETQQEGQSAEQNDTQQELIDKANSSMEPIQAESTRVVRSGMLGQTIMEMVDVFKKENIDNL